MAVLSCHVCGQEAPVPVRAEGHAFCCPGCRELWRTLGEEGLAALRQGPPAPGPAGPAAPPPALDWPAVREEVSGEPAAPEGGDLRGATLALDGLWCPSCATLVEHVLSRRPGVVRVRVDFAAGTAEAAFDPQLTDADALCRTVARLGYGASARGGSDAEIPGILRRLAVAVPASALVMMFSTVVWSGYLPVLPPGLRTALAVGLWLGATPVVFWAGWPFLRGAWTSALHGRPSMDALVAIGSLAAYGYSVAAAATGGAHLYFDTSCMIITFLLFGRALELATRDRAAGVMRLLADLAATRAIVLDGGVEREIPASDVRTDDLVVVRPGQRVPADGSVVRGRGALDESVLSGESLPVDKGPADIVYAGSLSLNGRLVVRASRVGEATALGQGAAAVRAAQGRGRVQRLADRLIRVFVPLVLVLGAATFAFWSGPGGMGSGAALWRAIAVLVIACPCALGVATPLAVLAGARRLGGLGVLLRAGDALERAASVDVVLVDKTGTVTDGKMRVVDCQPRDESLLSWAASVEAGSRHPIALAVLRAAEERGLPVHDVADFVEHAGIGVEGWVDGRHIRVGRLAPGEVPPALRERVGHWEGEGRTSLLVSVDGRVAGALAVGDGARAEAAEAMAALAGQGLDVRLASGDAEGTAAAVARAVGIKRWYARQLPADKALLVEELQADGHRVAFVGDGANDAPALARADLGIALASGADIALEAGHLTLVRSDLGGVAATLRLARRALAIIRQNLAWALLYNLVAIPAAVMGYARPAVAAAAMVGSSAFVLGNSLRLLGWSPRRWALGALGVLCFVLALVLLAWRGW